MYHVLTEFRITPASFFLLQCLLSYLRRYFLYVKLIERNIRSFLALKSVQLLALHEVSDTVECQFIKVIH